MRIILALSSKTALRVLKCPWGVQVVNLINPFLPGSLLLLLLQGHFRQGSLKYSSRGREELKKRGFDLKLFRKIKKKQTWGVSCCCHLSYVRFANGRVQCVQLCVVRGQNAFSGLFGWTFWAVSGQFSAFVQVRGRPRRSPRIFCCRTCFRRGMC